MFFSLLFHEASFQEKTVRDDKALIFNYNIRLTVDQSSQMAAPVNIVLQGRISIYVRSRKKKKINK